MSPARSLALLLVLLLSPILSALAVGIEPEASPSATTPKESALSLPQMLPNTANDNGLKLSAGDADSRDKPLDATISLTNDQLAPGKGSAMSDQGWAHLLLSKDKAASSRLPYPDASRYLITLEGLAISEGFSMPDPPVLIAMGTTAALSALAALVYRHLSRSKRRCMRFGVLWNGYRKPLCVKCNGPLHVLNDYSFQCPTCRVELGAIGDNGRTISPHEALEKVRLKEYWSPN